MAQAIDNANLIQGLCNINCAVAGFNPVVPYTFDAAAKTVAVSDTSAFPAGDGLRKVKVQVFDKFGGEVRGTIATTGGGGAQTISVATLNLSKPLDVKVTVITNNGLVADGGAYNLMAAGNLASWDKQ